jgi:hypothetical protein
MGAVRRPDPRFGEIYRLDVMGREIVATWTVFGWIDNATGERVLMQPRRKVPVDQVLAAGPAAAWTKPAPKPEPPSPHWTCSSCRKRHFTNPDDRNCWACGEPRPREA